MTFTYELRINIFMFQYQIQNQEVRRSILHLQPDYYNNTASLCLLFPSSLLSILPSSL